MPILLVLAPLLSATAWAGQGDARLEPLFRDLPGLTDPAAATAAENRIWDIWLENTNRDLLGAMRDGVQQLNADRYEPALAAFNRVVECDPNYAEGWDKRANAEYMLGDYESAVRDLARVLVLEPRHFGALTTLGLVYLAIDDPAAALRAFDAALAIDPHLGGVREQAMKIRERLANATM